MHDNEDSRFMTSLWRNLKRALISSPDVQSGTTVYSDCEPIITTMNTSNYSNNSVTEPTILSNLPLVKTVKRQRLNLAIDNVSVPEENSFMEVMKNLLSCSICLEVNNYSNQCPNGHLICITCSGRLQQSPGDLSCPVCRVSLKQGLHRSLLAEQLTSELPAACRHCKTIMPVKHVKKHETEQCQKRLVQCQYKLFGCSWIGLEENCSKHISGCSISTEMVGSLYGTVSANITKDFNSIHTTLQLWRSIVSKIRLQAVGSRILIRQTALNKTVSDELNQIIFKSPVIRLPFSCCSLHGFYVDIFVTRDSGSDVENLSYVLRSENRTKISLNYFLASIKVDESINLELQDSLHCHQFESNHKDSVNHDIKLVSVDCDKAIPKLSEFESIFVEICLMSERERSERGHGILNSNDEDEINGGSEGNVVFTLFSPNSSSSRSMNTSNTAVAGTDESNTLNDAEPSHEEDIVITVTDNTDSVDEISADNRHLYGTRNNHSYVAVPSIFLNPAASVFAYSPFQLENTYLNGNFQQAGLAREAQYYDPDNQPVLSQQEVVRLQTGNLNRTTRPGEPTITHDNQFVQEPIQMSLFYPSQTIVSPNTTNSVSHIAVRPSIAPRNFLVRPRQNSNQVFTIQPRLTRSSDDDRILIGSQQPAPSNNIVTDTYSTAVSDQNDNLPYPYARNESLTIEVPLLQEYRNEE